MEAHRLLSQTLRDEDLIDSEGRQKSKTFHQLKYHAHSEEANEIWPDGQCMLQTYNVFGIHLVTRKMVFPTVIHVISDSFNKRKKSRRS